MSLIFFILLFIISFLSLSFLSHTAVWNITCEYKLNSTGERMLPCLTPRWIDIPLHSRSLMSTVALWFWFWSSWIFPLVVSCLGLYQTLSDRPWSKYKYLCCILSLLCCSRAVMEKKYLLVPMQLLNRNYGLRRLRIIFNVITNFSFLMKRCIIFFEVYIPFVVNLS